MTEIHIRDPSASGSNPAPRVKPPPKPSALPVPFSYAPSDDGTDENILILLHGLGDTHLPFAKLGRQLKLPQTAVLALRAPEQVPFLYEESYQWYRSFDDLGELIERPNPTPALDLLSVVLNHLIDDCGWPQRSIHFFGFAQGGSVAAEFGINWWKLQLQTRRERDAAATAPDKPQDGADEVFSLGSIVTISGPLLSYPTLSSPSPTPLLVIYDPALPPGAIAACKRAYATVAETESANKETGMPASKKGWEPIMRFWSTNLGRRRAEGLYEVMSGLGH